MAVAFLLAAALFCWVFVEACLGEAAPSGSIVKIAFVVSGVVFSMIFIGGALQGAGGFPGVALYLMALTASYVAVLGERWAATLGDNARNSPARVTLRAMARGAADTSLLSRISGRPDLGRDR
jgi:hypothetical protein